MTDFGERRRVLPKTGQTDSWHDGDDGYYQKGWRDGERFKDVGDGTVVDNATGLMWPKDTDGPGGNNGATDNWSNAIDYAEALSFAGYTDWRLPNVLELVSLLDFSISCLDVYALILNAQEKALWTSTTGGSWMIAGWAFWSQVGTLYTEGKTSVLYFFCCRDA